MEAAVNMLEATFQKAEADLECIEKQIKLEFMTDFPDNGLEEENPVKILEKLNTIKARYKAVSSQLKEITALQKESMDVVRAHFGTTVQLLQELQQTSDFMVPTWTDEEKEAAECLCLPVSQHSGQTQSDFELPSNQQAQALSKKEFAQLSEEQLGAVPCSVRCNVKLTDLNMFYKQLFEHFTRNNSGTLNMLQMKKMNMKVNDAMLKTLKHLSLIEMDKKGNVHLAPKD
ncbi:SKA complex subunit 2 [Scleropages formosus]|uniref:Protein FAM33A n=1 Tax=Scleropages formosus TaxID=113540 RepID=A0A8C9R2J8_SCLFO|nr:spindle and kinetochore-associated protein 2 [Scleropages formosus]